MGNEPTGAGFPRPPLAPGWLLVPFIHYLGTDIGYKVWSSLASLLPVIPVYLFTRRIGVAASLFAAGFLLLDLNHAEMVVTGALPLIAFGILGTAWWLMSSLTERWSWRMATLLAGCVGIIPWVNQTTAGLAVITIPVFAAALLWYNRRGVRSQRIPTAGLTSSTGTNTPAEILSWPSTTTLTLRLAVPLAVGGVIALGALPWYIQVLPGSGVLRYPGPMLYLASWADSAWWQMFLALPLGIYLIRRGDTPWLRSLGVITCLLGGLTVFMSTDETILNVFYRSRYLLPLPWFIGISWLLFTHWLPNLRWKTVTIIGTTSLALGVMAFGYVHQFNRQAFYSAMATPATVEALALTQAESPGSGVLNNSFTLALWISALHRVPSPHTWTWEPPAKWTETDKDVRCLLGWTECDPVTAQGRLDVGWVLIDERFPYYNKRAPSVYGSVNKEAPWADLPTVPWLTPVFHSGTTELYKINLTSHLTYGIQYSHVPRDSTPD